MTTIFYSVTVTVGCLAACQLAWRSGFERWLLCRENRKLKHQERFVLSSCLFSTVDETDAIFGSKVRRVIFVLLDRRRDGMGWHVLRAVRRCFSFRDQAHSSGHHGLQVETVRNATGSFGSGLDLASLRIAVISPITQRVTTGRHDSSKVHRRLRAIHGRTDVRSGVGPISPDAHG